MTSFAVESDQSPGIRCASSGLRCYDVLDRPILIRHPTGLSTQIGYQGLLTTSVNPAGQIKTEQKNPLGEIIRSTDSYEHSTCYLHDAHGNLVRVGRSASAVCTWPFAETLTDIVYDSLGRKTAMVDADMGGWQYQYNAAGELIKQISSRGQCTVNRYDLRGRLFRRQDYSNAACTALEQQADFEFDTQKPGRLSAETVPGYRRAFSYDSFGRPSITTTTIDANNYTEQTTYDHLGRVFQQFDASGQGVLTEYTSRGFVKRLRDARPGRQEWLNNDPTRTITFAGSWGEIYYEVRAMDAREQVTLDWRGVVSDSETDQSLSGLAVARQYRGDTGWLSSIQAGDAVGGASTRLQHLAYQYDAVGNLRERQDLQLALRETFTYDLVNRLDTVERSSNGSLIGFEDYGYDAWGNILVKPGLSGIGYSSREIACGAGAAPGPHALSRATIEGSAKQYCYDPAGNQTATWAGAQKQREIVYSAADQVKEIKSWVANHNTRFFYGPGRNRYKRLDTDTPDGTGGITTTHYVGSVEIIKKPNGTWEKKRYIGGVLIVTLASDGGGSKDYLFTDHLGSTDVIAHRFGNVLQRMSFDAFGARRNPTANNAPTPWGTLPIIQQLNFDTTRTTHGYTGHEGADKVGLIHMNGRMYDPVLGRFIQADSIVQDPFDPQSLNRYAYVLNNPLSATDPSGNISFKNALRLGISIGIAVATSGLASALVAEHMIGAAIVATAFGGAAASVAAVGPKGAVRGAVTSLVFFGVGQGATALQGAKGSLSEAAFADNGLGRAAMHGIAGGTLAALQGGNFGHGFLTAGVGKAVTSRVALTGNDLADGAIAALVGGTLSEASGDSFTNGALTGAMQFAFNSLLNADQLAAEQMEEEVARRVEAALRADGFKNVTVLRRVTLSVTMGDGTVVEAVADYAYRVGDKVFFGEVKTGLFSRFSANQKLVYAAINQGQVSVVSASKAFLLRLTPGDPIKAAAARFVLHAEEGGRAARQFGRLFAGSGNVAARGLGAAFGTSLRILGSTTFFAATSLLQTNSVSAQTALSMECQPCTPKASVDLR